jgi:hypothetical protein
MQISVGLVMRHLQSIFQQKKSIHPSALAARREKHNKPKWESDDCPTYAYGGILYSGAGHKKMSSYD